MTTKTKSRAKPPREPKFVYRTDVSGTHDAAVIETILNTPHYEHPEAEPFWCEVYGARSRDSDDPADNRQEVSYVTPNVFCDSRNPLPQQMVEVAGGFRNVAAMLIHAAERLELTAKRVYAP